ncbi:5-oxoprolinase subunit C family protein [Algoriphagus litoralis]|uniref:5-oxoprolinase subunit C family protein n=1 Tax=Algoriphagus litoralis TaxID=2202829 RepID=UPI000DBAB238|nr:biotin-dependent carboxyltransferase family protein [Algoriphagus litoralis]
MSKEMAIATLIKSGPGSSIQDLGRIGLARYGVPHSGPMDMKSFAWVNHILQNEVYNAVLEIAQPGFLIRFDSPTCLALAGGQATISLNGQEIEKSTMLSVKSNDELEIGGFQTGALIYIGIRYGFKSPKVMGSRSFYSGLTASGFLHKGDKLTYFNDSNATPLFNAKAKWSTDWFQTDRIDVYPGPDFHLLEDKVKEKLWSQAFKISQQSNRMGTQLLELVENSLPELPTNPVFPGTVQLTSGGKVIILGQDAQVTGGYPRILQLTDLAKSILAQKKPGQSIRFSLMRK